MKTKKLLILFLFLAPFTFLIGQSSLTIEITGLENNKGRVIVALLDKNEKDLKNQTCKIVNQRCTLTFQNLKHDMYAVRFFHDENRNEELDTNILGIPKEGFGFSNDAMGKFGPKDFSEWLFRVSDDTKIKITTNYIF